MSHPKRPPPEVDHVTPELEALLAQFSDEEIASGVITRAAAAVPAARHTSHELLARLNDALDGA
jgi:hypothetical protein